MSRYLVDVTEYWHTCPAHNAPHVVSTSRTVVEHTTGGPCQHPHTVRSGTVSAVIDCTRFLPNDQRCISCRTIITVRATTRVDLAPDTARTSTTPSGLAERPCTVCGKPLAAVLASWGVHLLCQPFGARP